ncbi:putative serine protease K12H4.7-like protein [Leptotrombidium deliense]|uniref:Putative serine protease K12H4.7-like protein n=1 Tax=Leptotrombidium deliense TaxID=299467 RepID=A0A443RU02_9ACAR|nr:putative serine protease K12H4.7-like protein [Leptotrombidium deliense]
MNAIVVAVLFNALLVTADPLFFRGRPWGKYGFLTPPKRSSAVLYSESIEPQWMQQSLDHFNPADTRTWKQRYFVSDQHFKPGGPVFLQLGGEGTADPVWLSEGQAATNFAKRYNAYSILLEHRYYGESHPTKFVCLC